MWILFLLSERCYSLKTTLHSLGFTWNVFQERSLAWLKWDSWSRSSHTLLTNSVLFFFLQRHMRDNAKAGLHCRSGCASLRMVGYSPVGRWELAMCRDFGCGDGGGPTGPNRLPTRGPVCRLFSAVSRAHRVSSVLRLCAGRLACIWRPCGTCWGWPGACSERELQHLFGI